MHLSQATRGLLLFLSAGLIFSFALVPSVQAQAISASAEMDELAVLSATASINDSGPEGIIPALRGFNLALGTSSQHDSTNGWSSILNPTVAYRLNRYFSVDASVPIFLYINIDENLGTKARPHYGYLPKKFVFGDTSLSFEGDADKWMVDYNGTFTLGLPSGNIDYGLGTGQVTYNFNNHFARRIGIVAPDIEVGFGDTSILVDQRVLKSYVSVGPMAHFQAGLSVELPWSMTFETNVYEELPLAKDLVYSTTGKGKKKVTTSFNQDPSEDNGFITSLDIPLSRHVTMSGFYNRSLRDRVDLAGFSFTFILKAPPRFSDLMR